ncbi:UNVERIFIED_CONTAM: hypothetical protein HDU68_009901 [Siphonaria sp. JEL0065]|nr:hypothetical protein HDU68_009901 [Siphonaria sp. JEL0065]
MTELAKVTISIPFASPDLASIASQVLGADRNPKDTELSFTIDDSNPSALKLYANVTFCHGWFFKLRKAACYFRTITSRDIKLLRTAVTSVMESIQLVSDGIDAFQ